MNLVEFKQQFEPGFDAVIRARFQTFFALSQDEFLNTLVGHSLNILSGGKRLRPYLAYLGYTAGGGQASVSEMQHLGTGLELFHAFCLVHDDIIDKALMRRGVPTIDDVALTALQANKRHGDLAHIARGQAILIGDLLHAYSLESIVKVSALAGCHPDFMSEAYKMVDEVIVGQMIDVDMMTRTIHDQVLLERKMYLKTASYFFIRPFTLGLYAAGCASPAHHEAAASIGGVIGIAFQLQDDTLDITSTSEVLGKPVLSDIRDGQQTFLTAHVALHGDQAGQTLLREVMCGDASEAQVMELQAVMLSEGAVAAAHERIDMLLAQAKTLIAASPFSAPVQLALQDLVLVLKARQS
jgi:geranylgeranyl diphosphate synthase type I